jgi:hypothetical protein
MKVPTSGFPHEAQDCVVLEDVLDGVREEMVRLRNGSNLSVDRVMPMPNLAARVVAALRGDAPPDIEE